MKGWFEKPGAYVLVDGQYGSTGKGLLAAYLAHKGQGKINVVTTNAGPNSGHTAYQDGVKIMTQQIPVASVVLRMLGAPTLTYLNAGAIIDEAILKREMSNWLIDPMVHPCAALITDHDRQEDGVAVANIASTGKGVGPSIRAKIKRDIRYRDVVAAAAFLPFLRPGRHSWDNLWDWSRDVVFVETAQGFSLGLNTAKFYPHVTSRECTVMQAIADARIPVDMVKGSVATFRTFPIRVGNTATGYSGDCYGDQEETTWEKIGQTPELTSVTKRVRRVFTWSDTQFAEAIAANRPDSLFLNFCNYLPEQQLRGLVQQMLSIYSKVVRRDPLNFLLGFSERTEDIYTVEERLGL